MGNSSGVQDVGTIATIQSGSEFCQRANDTSLNCALLMDRREGARKTQSEKVGRGCPGEVYWLHQFSIFVVV